MAGQSSKKIKRTGSSLWTSTLEGIDKIPFPTDQEIEKVKQDMKENNIDINKPTPEIEELANIFKPKNQNNKIS